MLTTKQIFEELSKDNQPTQEDDSNNTLQSVVEKLDETTKKFNDFQEEVTKAFENQMDGITKKISELTTHEETTDEESEEKEN